MHSFLAIKSSGPVILPTHVDAHSSRYQLTSFFLSQIKQLWADQQHDTETFAFALAVMI